MLSAVKHLYVQDGYWCRHVYHYKKITIFVTVMGNNRFNSFGFYFYYQKR